MRLFNLLSRLGFSDTPRVETPMTGVEEHGDIPVAICGRVTQAGA